MTLKGVSQKPKEPPFIANLRPIHAYQKGIEATEKAIRLKVLMGFYPSEVPSEPLREITPNEVYELVLRLDGILTILLRRAGYTEAEEYIYKLDRKIPDDKTPSHVYNNLWKISNTLDVLLDKEYTPDESFALAQKIGSKVVVLLRKLKIRKEAIDRVLKSKINIETKTPKDVFKLTLKLYREVKDLQNRMNMETPDIIIPQERNITHATVYNSLRIINAGINEILMHKDVDEDELPHFIELLSNKSTEDVFREVLKIYNLILLLYDQENYEA